MSREVNLMPSSYGDQLSPFSQNQGVSLDIGPLLLKPRKSLANQDQLVILLPPHSSGDL